MMTAHLANSLRYPVDGLREALESLPEAKRDDPVPDGKD